MPGGSPTKIDLDEARRLYESGLSCRQIAAIYGASFSRVASRLRKAGVPMRASGRPLPTPDPSIDLNELVWLRETGYTYRELAAKYGVSTDMVRDRYLRATDRQRRGTSSSIVAENQSIHRARADDSDSSEVGV